METEEKARGDIKWLLETLCHLQDWLNEDDRKSKQHDLDQLVKRYKSLQSSNRTLISKANKTEMQYRLEQELDQVCVVITIFETEFICLEGTCINSWLLSHLCILSVTGNSF